MNHMRLAAAVTVATALLALGAPAAPAAAAKAACAFPAPPTVLSQQGDPHQKGGRLLQGWEFPDDPVWWSTADPDGYADFRRRAASKVGDTSPLRLPRQAPSRNNAIVVDAGRAWIRPATCLQKLLQQAQDRRIDTFVSPTEFVSFILRSPDGQTLRVYFYTINEDGIGRVTPVAEPVAQAAREGWSVVAGLHNHNFHPKSPALNGPLAPSAPDAQFNTNFAREAGMAAAWITNGLHTAQIPASAFDRFEQ